MKEITLITGGARSGKSSFALRRAAGSGASTRIFIATAIAFDDEMKQRIERHRMERSSEWETIEEPYDVGGALRKIDSPDTVVLLDCITLWLSNIFLKVTGRSGDEDFELHPEALEEIDMAIEDFLSALRDVKYSSIFIVTNEVGMGIVPEKKLGRLFRDVAGTLNQRMAEIAGHVYLMVSGQPLKIK